MLKNQNKIAILYELENLNETECEFFLRLLGLLDLQNEIRLNNK